MIKYPCTVTLTIIFNIIIKHMKKLILSLALLCASTNFYAQETDLGALINQGKAALEAKNYQEAYTKFSSYLSQTHEQDSVIAYNCGVCADKIKKPAEAAKYFGIAVDKKYNLANAYIGLAGALKDQKKNAEYLNTLKAGLEAVPNNKTLTKMLATYYVNQGTVALQGKKQKEAEEAFKEALEVQPKNINALNRLGSLYYTRGAGLVATDLEKAKDDFKLAKQYLEQLLPLLSPQKAAHKKMQSNTQTMLDYINSQIQ